MAANPQARSQPAPTVKLLINGQFVESKAKAWRDVVNPATTCPSGRARASC